MLTLTLNLYPTGTGLPGGAFSNVNKANVIIVHYLPFGHVVTLPITSFVAS